MKPSKNIELAEKVLAGLTERRDKIVNGEDALFDRSSNMVKMIEGQIKECVEWRERNRKGAHQEIIEIINNLRQINECVEWRERNRETINQI